MHKEALHDSNPKELFYRGSRRSQPARHDFCHDSFFFFVIVEPLEIYPDTLPKDSDFGPLGFPGHVAGYEGHQSRTV